MNLYIKLYDNWWNNKCNIIHELENQKNNDAKWNRKNKI